MNAHAAGTKRIAVVGFGHIGCTLGAVLADRGFEVIGIDTSTRVVEAVNSGQSPFNEPGLHELVAANVAGGRLKATHDYGPVGECNVVLITVGTPLSDDGVASLEQITQASRRIASHVRDGRLVILKSTVPPNTTSQVVLPILRTSADVLVAFCPERLAEGHAIRDLTTIPVVVGGVDERSSKAAAAFWRETLALEVIEVSDDRTSEMVKLADNLWIDLNIALANELAKLCNKLEIDALEVIDAANTLPKGNHNVNILVPSLGVGGACLTKDPWVLYRMGKDLGLELHTPQVSRRINDGMPAYTVSLIDEALLQDGRAAKHCRVAVLGLAFKSNTSDCRFTPAKPAIEALVDHGYQVVVHDPWVSRDDARTVTPITLTHDIEVAVSDADCVAFLAGHQEFHDFPVSRLAELAKPRALVFDGRIYFSREKIQEIRSLGLRYKGVGR